MKVFDFTYFKPYVILDRDVKETDAKHTFYELEMSDIERAELRINKSFPSELREFYQQIGYGFLCSSSHHRINRLMDPASVADFVLGVQTRSRHISSHCITMERRCQHWYSLPKQ